MMKIHFKFGIDLVLSAAAILFAASPVGAWAQDANGRRSSNIAVRT